jgi:serine/threonine protein kinase
MTDLPERIGPYKILEKLGEGGFATVYLAQANHLNQAKRVALKVLNSDQGYRRFQREVETVARLEHPNIIRIFDTGEDERSGVPYFAMEYIPGGTLRDKLEAETSLPVEDALKLIRQVGAALTYAHSQGIIHRDVNPNNILLDTSQTPICPLLTDFGLVKPLVPDDDMTMTVGIVGTFHYYAPEQWNKEAVTPATDLYALAITFFETIVGQRPFKGDIFSLRDKHLDEPLPSLSNLAPDISPFFEDVLIKATAKDPADRYESVAAFIEALEAAHQKANNERQYQEVRHLFEAEEYLEALEHLDSQFIRPGNYEYRDVAKLFWELIYAKQHNGTLPPITKELPDVQPMVTQPAMDVEETSAPHLESEQHRLWLQHEISKYIIPLTLGLAALAGGVIEPQLPAWLQGPVPQITAAVLLIAYLVYYIWAYYLSHTPDE